MKEFRELTDAACMIDRTCVAEAVFTDRFAVDLGDRQDFGERIREEDLVGADELARRKDALFDRDLQ